MAVVFDEKKVNRGVGSDRSEEIGKIDGFFVIG